MCCPLKLRMYCSASYVIKTAESWISTAPSSECSLSFLLFILLSLLLSFILPFFLFIFLFIFLSFFLSCLRCLFLSFCLIPNSQPLFYSSLPSIHVFCVTFLCIYYLSVLFFQCSFYNLSLFFYDLSPLSPSLDPSLSLTLYQP